uniref:Transcription factor, putative n=1 Tax=Arundo donax TaxID=35708 RepID=A0A0A9CGS7_ARUDO
MSMMPSLFCSRQSLAFFNQDFVEEITQDKVDDSVRLTGNFETLEYNVSKLPTVKRDDNAIFISLISIFSFFCIGLQFCKTRLAARGTSHSHQFFNFNIIYFLRTVSFTKQKILNFGETFSNTQSPVHSIC